MTTPHAQPSTNAPSHGAPITPSGASNNPFEKAPETAEEVEQIRRSVAMLPPGSWAMRREPALTVLAALLKRIRAER